MATRRLSKRHSSVKPEQPAERLTGYDWLLSHFTDFATPAVWDWLLKHRITKYPRTYCPFHDHDTEPSAVLINHADLIPALVCYDRTAHNRGDGEGPIVLSLAEVYFRMKNPRLQFREETLPAATQHMWSVRALINSGLLKRGFQPQWPEKTTKLIGYLQTRKTVNLSTRGNWSYRNKFGISTETLCDTYDAIREISICGYKLHANWEVVVTKKFLSEWSGLSSVTSGKAIKFFVASGLIRSYKKDRKSRAPIYELTDL